MEENEQAVVNHQVLHPSHLLHPSLSVVQYNTCNHVSNCLTVTSARHEILPAVIEKAQV